MPTVRSIEQVEKVLQKYIGSASLPSGRDKAIERVEPLMASLGCPQEKLRVVHIAGTSGKTSTAYYVSALLQAAGQRTGLAISPHVDLITERVQINGQSLSEQEFCDRLSIFLRYVDQLITPISYFDILYSFAIWVFAEQNLDYAVVETGIGGLYDTTNIVTRADKLCVITDIGLDHMAILGNTLPEIARQKIGIVHPGNEVIMYRQSREIMNEVIMWVAHQRAQLQLLEEPASTHREAEFSHTLPQYQQRNWLLANAAYSFLGKRDRLPILSQQDLLKTQNIIVPARMEIRSWKNKTLIMDGAHNYQKMAACIESYKLIYPDHKPIVLLALKKGKDFEAMVNLLVEFADQIVVTTFQSSAYLPAQSMAPQIIVDLLIANGFQKACAIPDQSEAVDYLVSLPEKFILVTGSFYLISQLRAMEHFA